MKVIQYADIFPWTTGKKDVYFYEESNLPQKQPGSKRYRIVVEIPDFHEVDGTIKTSDVTEVKDAPETVAPVEQAKTI